ncbi:GNAT family N-acetyltransferase [Aldersonia sp. NBC_00410]|uniref:bifunctional acetate--CoA ligase family protein/GNAT family N-acetyltransferase n=1 Tax=Aldersonia sp. NBC_00410 TaxID=2975954 RepID=UPI002255C92C|nr:bifunctional GNAT family N-acetyltransferase/acetate--CoA ligase family protein [Aldersonia sp. NBC_00410]MCX5042582.1 GNAT family N-acetyltransferase [Aldersonia sp. NBC_00410]
MTGDANLDSAQHRVTSTDPEFPRHWIADVLASDGGVVTLRPIAPEDADLVVAFHEALSDRSRYLRYFGPHPRLSAKELAHDVNIDYRNRVAFVAVLGDEIIGIGRYERLLDDAGSRSAEVAFVIADAHQSRGLGSILLEHLAGAAAENGIETFVAEVLAENRGMLMVFREAGYQLQRSLDGSVMHLAFAIDPTDALLSVRDARERASEARSVRNLLSPRSVAVIGASVTSGKVGTAALANLLAAEFSGPVYPVNSAHRSVHGVRSYATVRDIPDDVDLAVVAVPAEAMTEVFDDCLVKGVKGLVVLTAGFAEEGTPEGRAAEQRLVQDARRHGMRVVGPNALGIANTDPAVALNATLAPVLPERGRVGFFCQSGPLGGAILREAASRGVGLSTFVSAGNRADVSGNDLLQYWDTDADTEVVLLYLETFGNPRKFSRIARRVARAKPIVVVGTGRTGPVGSDEADSVVVRDLFAQTGIIEVESVNELFDCAVLLGYQPLPGGSRLAIVGNTAALIRLTRDKARADGFDVGPTVNLGPAAKPDDYREALRTLLTDGEVDSVVVIFSPAVPVGAQPFAEALRSVVDEFPGKPVLSSFTAEEGIPRLLAVRDDRGHAVRGSIPSYSDPQRAVHALAQVRRYAAWRTKPASAVARPDGMNTERARALVDEWLAQRPEGRWLNDLEAVQLFACFGIDVIDFREVTGSDEAAAAADELGYPVAVKATGEMWRQRADLDGVRLDLANPDSVRLAYHDLSAISGQSLVHVQRMARKGLGVVLRVQDDPSFGSVIQFGLSGMIMDLIGDRAYRALPLTEDGAMELVDAPRAAPLLSGYRTALPVDKAAVAQLAQRVSAICDDLPAIRELTLEPVLVSAESIEVLYGRLRIGPEPSNVDVGPRRLG